MSVYQSKVIRSIVWGISAVCSLDAMLRHEGAWRVVFAALDVLNVAYAADQFSQRFDKAEREEV